MDLGSTIVGAIILLLCIIPFALMQYKRVKKEKQKLQSLQVIAQQQNCNISQHELCGDFALGIDDNKRFVFFIKQKQKEAISQFINLSDIHTCKAIKMTHTSKYNNESSTKIDRVDLSFMPNQKNQSQTTFQLFDADTNLQLSGELQFVDKWSKTINDLLVIKK